MQSALLIVRSRSPRACEAALHLAERYIAGKAFRPRRNVIRGAYPRPWNGWYTRAPHDVVLQLLVAKHCKAGSLNIEFRYQSAEVSFKVPACFPLSSPL